MDPLSTREEQVFTAALELPAADRPAFLAAECGDDSALLERILQLLRAHDEMGDFLADAATGSPIRPSDAASPGGQWVGRYHLLQLIGEGGCGAVYLAEQEEPIRRRVAIKVIKPGMDTQEVIRRFESERQALALMDHPNIARVLDAGTTDAGRPFFVMELVRGVPITRYCDENELATPARLQLFIQVCRAVQHAHQKGVIHRDLKPSNVLVTLQDGEPVPKVIDFGIAKATQGRLTDRTLFTAVQQFVGTPVYMSPEQAMLSSADVDTRSDIYSLGVLLYELLTGQPPFDPKRLTEAGVDEMRRLIRDVDPARPSTRLRTLDQATLRATARSRQVEPPRLIHSLEGDLDWVVMRCLEKQRARRYGTATELVHDLERHLRHEPVAARPPGAAYLLHKAFQRHRLALLSTSAVVAALVAGLAAALWLYAREKEARQRAVAAERDQASLRRQAEIEAERSRQSARFLTAMLEGVGPSVARGRDTTLIREILDQTVVRLGTDLKDQPEIEADLRAVAGRLYRDLGDHGAASTMLERALVMQRQVRGPDAPETAAVLRLLGLVRLDRGDLAGAERLLRDVLALRRHQREVPARDLAQAAGDLAAVLFTRTNFAEAAPLFREQLNLLARTGATGTERGSAFSGAVVSLVMLQDLAGARAAGREELARVEAAQGADSIEAEILRQTLELALRPPGSAEQRAAQIRNAGWLRAKFISEGHADPVSTPALALLVPPADPGAERLARKILALQQRRYGEETLEVADAMVHLGGVLMVRGEQREARRLLEQGLATQRRLLGRQHASVAATLQLLGWALQHEGDAKGAVPLFRESVAICRSRFPALHPATAEALFALAVGLHGSGGGEEARAIFDEVLAIRRRALPPDDPDLADTLVWTTLVAPPDTPPGEIIGRLREALANRAHFYGEDSPECAEVLSMLVQPLTRQAEFAAAEACARQAWQIIERTPTVRPDIRRTGIGALAELYAAWSRVDPARQKDAVFWAQVRTGEEPAVSRPAEASPSGNAP